MGVFHVFYIVQIVPNRATHHIVVSLKTAVTVTDIMEVLGSVIAGFVIFLTSERTTFEFSTFLNWQQLVLTFSVLDLKHPFWANLVQKNQIYQFQLKFGTKNNSNMQNSMALFTFSVLDWKNPFQANFVQKAKIDSFAAFQTKETGNQ